MEIFISQTIIISHTSNKQADCYFPTKCLLQYRLPWRMPQIKISHIVSTIFSFLSLKKKVQRGVSWKQDIPPLVCVRDF